MVFDRVLAVFGHELTVFGHELTVFGHELTVFGHELVVFDRVRAVFVRLTASRGAAFRFGFGEVAQENRRRTAADRRMHDAAIAIEEHADRRWIAARQGGEKFGDRWLEIAHIGAHADEVGAQLLGDFLFGNHPFDERATAPAIGTSELHENALAIGRRFCNGRGQIAVPGNSHVIIEMQVSAFTVHFQPLARSIQKPSLACDDVCSPTLEVFMPRRRLMGLTFAWGFGLGLALLGGSCSGDGDDQTQNMTMDMEKPFEPVSATAYSAKVKNLLTGLPLTDAEVQAVTADATALNGLIDTWMATPQFDAKMLQFFQQSFQQTQLTITSFVDQLANDTLRFDNGTTQNRFLNSARDSFPRTALQVMKDGRPWTDVLTSNQYMLNAPLMSYMAYHDSLIINDKSQVTSRVVQRFPSFSVTFGTSTSTVGNVPVAQSVNPTSANFMKWTVPSPPTGTGCTDPYPQTGLNGTRYLFDFMMGRLRNCNPSGTPTALTSQFTQADFDTWKMVTIRAPKAGEYPTPFWDAAALRSATELVLYEPKVGFMTTPAFFANWPTNASNQQRLTINQTLIVALSKSFDDTINNNIPSIDELADDTNHASPGTICYSCHKSLDPMRQFWRQSYTFPYSTQADPAQTGASATFAFDGVTMPGTGKGVPELAGFLATHPRFATGWVQKLCFCSPSAILDGKFALA